MPMYKQSALEVETLDDGTKFVRHNNVEIVSDGSIKLSGFRDPSAVYQALSGICAMLDTGSGMIEMRIAGFIENDHEFKVIPPDQPLEVVNVTATTVTIKEGEQFTKFRITEHVLITFKLRDRLVNYP